MEIRSPVGCRTHDAWHQVGPQRLFPWSPLPSYLHQCCCCHRTSITWNAWNKKWFRFGIFFNFWSICMYIMRYMGDPCLNIKFIYVSYTPCTQRLKFILCNIFGMPVVELWPITWGQMWNFPPVAWCQCFNSFKFWRISNFRFQLGMPDLYYYNNNYYWCSYCYIYPEGLFWNEFHLFCEVWVVEDERAWLSQAVQIYFLMPLQNALS